MTWYRQVWHVLASDVRRSRVSLIILAAALVVGGVGIAPVVPSFAAVDLFSGAVLVLGVIVIAGLVQGDSPTEVGSYWTTLPLAPTAVLTAKLLLGAAILALAAAAAFLVCTMLGAPAGATAQMVAAAVPACGLGLLAILVVASLTRNLREFLLVAVVMPFAVALLVTGIKVLTGIDIDPDQMGRGVPLALTILGASGTLLVLAHLYRRRDLRRLIWGPGLLLASTAMIAPFTHSGERANVSPARPHPVLAFHMVPDTAAGPLTPYRAVMSVSVDGAPADLRVRLIAESAVLHLRDGRTVVMGRRLPEITPHQASIAPLEGLQWPYAPAEGPATFALAPDPRSRPPGPGSVASVDVFAQVELARLIPLGATPLVPGGSLRPAGGRIRITAVGHGQDSAVVATRILIPSAADPSDEATLSSAIFGDLSVTLVNEARHEAMALTRRNIFGGNVWLLLPGVGARDYDVTFGTRRADFTAAAPAPNDPWYAGAEAQFAAFVRLPSFYHIHLTYTSPNGSGAAISRHAH